jgi:hypothetical protein
LVSSWGIRFRQSVAGLRKQFFSEEKNQKTFIF